MPSTVLIYPVADHPHSQELVQPLTVDGSAYTLPGILGQDAYGYQGDDGNAPGLIPAALTLPAIEGAAAVAGIEVMVATHWPGDTVIPAWTTAGSTITLTIPATDRLGRPFTLKATDLIEVEVYQQTPVAGAPAAPSIAGLSATWTNRISNAAAADYLPSVYKWRTSGVAAAAGSVITVTFAASGLHRNGQIRILRGVNLAAPYNITTWTSAQIARTYSYPDAPSLTVTTANSLVVMSAGGNTDLVGYPTPVVPVGWTEIVNSAKANGAFRHPLVAAVLANQPLGSKNAPAMTGLDFGNAYAAVEAYNPALTTSVPVLVITAVADDTATAELVDGDVMLTAGNEIQRLRSYLVGSGTRTLTFSGQTTAAVNWNDTAAQIQTKLEALSNLVPGEILVLGGPLDVAPVTIEWIGGAYDLVDVAQITVSGSNVDPVNEVQSIASTATGGTWLADAGTVDTTALPHDATAAQLQSALEALPEIGLNNVEVSGGPLDDDPLVVEFVGALAGTDVATLGITDSTTGGTVAISPVTAGVAGSGMVVDTQQVGSPGVDLTLLGSFLDRLGAYEPQIHVFGVDLDSYVAGQTIDVRASDHDGNHSVAALLLVLDQNVDPAVLIGAIGAELGAVSGTTGLYGAVTPATSGARVLSILSKARVAGSYLGTPSGGSAPPGFEIVGEALADAMTLMVGIGPPVGAAPTVPGASAWDGSEAWGTGSVTLKPLVGTSAGTDLWQVLDGGDVTDWADITPAAGQMFEVVELGAGAIPVDAVVTGIRVRFAHSSDVSSQLRVALVGIDGADGVHLASEQQVGYIPNPGGGITTVQTNYWTGLADGSVLNDYERFGVALLSSTRHPALGNHRVYWVSAEVRYEPGGPVVSDVTGPAAEGDPIGWTYESAGGYQQTYYEIRVIQGAGQDPDTATVPDDPLAPATGELVYASGQVSGPLVRSVVLTDVPLSRGSCTVAVRAWASITSSLLVPSAWDTATFDITGTPTATPDQSGTEPSYDPATGAVDVTVVAPTGALRGWLERSADGGTVWTVTEGSPFVVTAGTNVLSDHFAPGAELVEYAVSFDEGPMSETGLPDQVGTTAVDTTPGNWLFIVPSAPALSMPVEPAGLGETELMRGMVALGDSGAVIAQSPRLGHQIDFRIRCRNGPTREGLMAILEGGYTTRVVHILGRSWLMRMDPTVEPDLQMQTWLDVATGGFVDAYEVSFRMVEVARL